ncbi:sensor histidine kinase [Rufibacter glacialis]|uniref:histidine kinase n=1 Tax=Rufibacter glacialis TaxID=1259555 RepID=A0A5M8QTX1_9BACT|nr:HAMP domain-containing sensor histidine kinase [Rufibacter glacialis]KAA6437642.1 HAMP domain-containing histidine kinase [Rufibacter glacialis]GGK57556.1 two-component sensor histidine kinase [Rufibacter glacialis]
MKLLNHATTYFAGLLLAVLSVWAGLFYVNMLDEIYDSMDDGLENQKILVVQKANQDSTVLQQREFEAGYFRIREIPFNVALHAKDRYQDTLMYMQNEQDYEPVRMLTTVFERDARYYELRLITSMVEEDDLIEDLLYSLLWLYLGLLASILILNNLLLKKIWQPFYRLLHRLQHFRLENPTPVPVQPTNIDEFQLLNQTVEKLLQQNVAAYQNQKAFIENASHELQTPLAISLNKLELLAESQPLQEAQLEQIGAVMENLERLTRLNKSLLLLSKIENRQFLQEEEVPLAPLLQKSLQDFSDQLAFKEITVSQQAEEEVTLTMNADLAAMLVLNLLKNALVHNVKGGFLRIQLTQTTLSFENSGREQPLEEEKVFTRFFKEASSSASTGLGLPIVKAICDLYGFQIHYSYQEGHTFTVRFR